MKKILLIISHLVFAAAGFAAGVYTLPILTAPAAPSDTEINTAAVNASFKGTFNRELPGSDFLHWGEGEISIGTQSIALMGEISPGPDYKLYLSPDFVQNEAEFNRIKSQSVRVGDVKTFKNFIVDVPESINPADYSTVVIWCESFGEFITAAQYQ